MAPGRAVAVAVAMGLDRLLREPPARLHPVVWAGAYLERSGRVLLRTRRPTAGLVAGAAAWAVGVVVATGAGAAAESVARRLPTSARPLARGVALWPLLALEGLLREVRAVEAAAGSLPAARLAVGRLVSRPVGDLDAAGVRQAALESLAENLSDSVVAPLCWYAVGGLPAAAAYRFVNTADAVWGYRHPWGPRGTCAARMDDLANLVPARLTGLLLAGRRVPPAALAREARATESPNAGWPMAALALRLGVRLAKRGSYVLNPDGRPPEAADAADALRLVAARGRLAGAVLAVAAAVRA
jgi:adenosylcobinamide-phosphate synthase